jgi:hypothetical protein
MPPAPSPKFSAVGAFTLAEVMMATVVALVAVVGLIQAVTIGAEMLDISRKQTVAFQLIQNEIDNLRLKDWATVNAMPSSAYVVVNSAGTGLVSGSPSGTAQTAFALTNYTQSYTPPYSGASNDDNANLLRLAKDFRLTRDVAAISGHTNFIGVIYTVTWTAGNRGKTYTRSGVTYYGKNGLNLYYQK